MTVTPILLPFRNETRCLRRVLTAPRWDLGNATWTVQPMEGMGPFSTGIYVSSIIRTALPAVGEATFRYRVGRIDGKMIGITGGSPAITTGTWNPSTDSVSAPDLRGHEVRIQVAPRVDNVATAEWKTVWWGTVAYQQDMDYAGGGYPAGERVYHCVDGLFRAKRWMLNRHGFYDLESGAGATNTPGHPGYNTKGGSGVTLGNKALTGVNYNWTGDTDATIFSHTWPGAGDKWTDLQAIENSLLVTRPKGEPIFRLSGALDLYNQSSQGNVWETSESESAWDFVAKAADFRSGRGVTFVDWTETSPTGKLTVFLSVRAQTPEDITWKDPATSADRTISGATTNHTDVAITLIGDHRNVADSFQLGDPDQFKYDYVESVGENLQVLATLSYFDTYKSLEKRWKDTLEDTFSALAQTKRIDDKWRAIWQLHGIPRGWTANCSDHNAGKTVTATRCDYRCNDLGVIVSLASLPVDFSPIMTRVLPDLPLFEGYKYDGPHPIRVDGEDESGTPPRRPPLILIRMNPNSYLTGEELVRPVTLNVSDDGILIYAPSDIDDTGASRVIGKMSTIGLASSYDLNQLGVTVGLQLAHRVRMANGDPAGRRKLTIEHKGLHLWVAHPGAIWDVDSENRSGDGSPAKRNACDATSDNPGILRDDRPALAQTHALSCSWYMTDRRTASWTLNCCGFLPDFEVADAYGDPSGTVTYPTIGQLVTTIAAGGQLHTINTPITSEIYDAETDQTTWQTDWADLDSV